MTERMFTLDPFQQESIEVLKSGHSVLVAAPTGSGKTVVAEYAVEEAQRLGEKVFYTTPIKALSNQKYRDFKEQYGADEVGLLTGDNAVNGNASVVVMTTEVLRNMLYAGSDLLEGLRYVVLDEVHYLQDAFRGPVWEEVIIHLPKSVRLVALSATVSNADELAEWITEVRGQTVAVLETTRPVELRDLYGVSERNTSQLHVVPVLVKGKPNREAFRFDLQSGRKNDRHDGKQSKQGKQRRRRPFSTPRRLDVVHYLRRRELLPGIFFIFSRAGCDDAVSGAIDSGIDLTTTEEKARIGDIAASRTSHLSERDLVALEYERFVAALLRGVGAHHAGMVPAFKETVELCFVEGLIKVVFATETLAMGINMPARSVVLDKLTKFTGETHESLTPGQYTQLTGRAGRRGIDPLGHALVLWSPYVTFDQVSRLAGSNSFPLFSSFRPSYNMAVNLVRRVEEDAASDLLRQSFAQFQARSAVAKLATKVQKRKDDVQKATDSLTVPRAEVEASRPSNRGEDGGSVADNPELADRIAKAVDRLAPGDVLAASATHERAVVVSTAFRRGQARVRLVNEVGDSFTIDTEAFQDIPDTIGTLTLPEPYAPNSDRFQAAVGHELSRASFRTRRKNGRPGKNRKNGSGSNGGSRAHLSVVRGGDSDDSFPSDNFPSEEHPGESSSSDTDQRFNLALLDQIEGDEREIEALSKRMAARDGSIEKQFAAVRGVLDELGYLDGWSLTDRGETLVRVYHERDLLITEALMSGLLDGLDDAELAGMVSGFTYEHRSATPPPSPWFPSKPARTRFAELEAMHGRINRLERAAGLPETSEPDPTIFASVHAWALGVDLDDVLDDDLTGGDFVRQIKQIIDLLRQLATAAPNPDTRRRSAAAADRLDRGVVTASGAVAGPSSGGSAEPVGAADAEEHAESDETDDVRGSSSDTEQDSDDD